MGQQWSLEPWLSWRFFKMAQSPLRSGAGSPDKRPQASSHLTRASGCTAILSTWTDLAAACLESFWNLQPFAEVLLAGGL